MKDFAGKVAFVTGGGSGVGLGQAKVFAELGCKVVIADIRQDHLDEAMEFFGKSNPHVHPIHLDVTDRKAFESAADETERVFGSCPQLLFNTAGVNSRGLVEEASFADWDWIMGVNFGGVLNGMMTFVPRMIKEGKGGHIVATSSVRAFHGSLYAAPYSASKAAVNNVMESYSLSLQKFGIGVSILCAANVNTRLYEACKTRPTMYSNSRFVETDERMEALRSVYQYGMDPIELAQHVRRGIESNALYIIPFPEAKERIQSQFRSIVDSVLPLAEDIEGVKKRSEALNLPNSYLFK